jgi:hypothetical protein
MNWYTLFYLFSILEKFTIAIGWGAGLTTAGYIVFTIIHFIQKYEVNTSDETYNSHKVAVKTLTTIKFPRITCLVLAIFFWLSLVFVPNRKDMIIIIAGGAVGQFVTSDSSARQLPADITRFLRGEILKATSELTDEAKQSIGIDTEVEKIKNASKEELEKMLLEKVGKEKK